MKKKIFVGINLSEKIKKELVQYQEKIESSFNDFCPIKWTKKDNLHVTMFFIGFVEFDDLMDVFDKVEEVVEGIDPFNIKIDSITYGPKGKTPKMIWANGKVSPSLIDINRKLEQKIYEVEATPRDFMAHITMGRIIQWQFKKIEEYERPEIEEYPNLSLNVDSIDIMESVKGRYVILKSINL